MQHFSLLDLSPVPEGQTAAEALANTVDLARSAEQAGYHRYWLAEHHNMPGIASAATPTASRITRASPHRDARAGTPHAPCTLRRFP